MNAPSIFVAQQEAYITSVELQLAHGDFLRSRWWNRTRLRRIWLIAHHRHILAVKELQKVNGGPEL